MKVKPKKMWIIMIISASIVAVGLLWLKSIQRPGMNINCSTILHYDHAAPDYVSTLEFTFRLERDYEGLVLLSGIINVSSDKQIVSRNIAFNYDIKTPGEILVRNTRYIKTSRDTASDDIINRSFLYVPEGTERQLKLSPLGNAWLLGNPQSPFALCVNRKN